VQTNSFAATAAIAAAADAAAAAASTSASGSPVRARNQYYYHADVDHSGRGTTNASSGGTAGFAAAAGLASGGVAFPSSALATMGGASEGDALDVASELTLESSLESVQLEALQHCAHGFASGPDSFDRSGGGSRRHGAGFGLQLEPIESRACSAQSEMIACFTTASTGSNDASPTSDDAFGSTSPTTFSSLTTRNIARLD
jgi:hypothetical protein